MSTARLSTPQGIQQGIIGGIPCCPSAASRRATRRQAPPASCSTPAPPCAPWPPAGERAPAPASTASSGCSGRGP
eukprot:1839624-Pyramimonas_sp.AAC.1